MRNREYVNPFNRPRDVGNAREKATNPSIEHPPGTHVPLNNPPYTPETKANQKGSLKTNEGSQVNPHMVPPGGRGIAGYRPTTYRSDTAVFKESGRVVKRDQAVGKVVKPTDHPNKDLNRIYGG